MPTSWYQAIPPILDQIQIEKPQSILDIGVGFGKYGLLLRDVVDIPYERYHKNQWQIIIDGVEAFELYRNPLHDFVYDHIYYGNVMEIIDQLPSYDCILFIDVLEHFTKEDGRKLIDKLLLHTRKSLIVSTPLYPAEQNAYLGNQYEKHISQWSVTDFLKYDFRYQRLKIGNNAAEIFHIFPQEASSDTHITSVSDTQLSKPCPPLKIGYILPHRNLTGGLKMLLEQMNQLQKRGHKVFAILRDHQGSKVLPDWYNTKVTKTILALPGKPYTNYVQDCDVLVAGWWEQLAELSQGDIPVVYWEQGHEALFGDCNNLSRTSALQKCLLDNYSSNVYFASASTTIQKILKIRYQVVSSVIPNFIDTEFYFPIHHSCRNNILMVGNPALQFKGFDVALRSLQWLWNQGNQFNVTWVCQVKPHVQKISFPLSIIVQPAQTELANYYRNADIFLFTSWYEGFGMPPLEAMASGTPVVTTDCGGNNEYIQPGNNALVADPGDIKSLAEGMAVLLHNEPARKTLATHGRKSAERFNSLNTISKMENLLLQAVCNRAGDKGARPFPNIKQSQ
ncbi:MAG: glycosyltransferase [Negativicutes bacterium]